MFMFIYGLILVGAAAQEPAPATQASAVRDELVAAFTVVTQDLQAAAEKMPADRYAFRPVEGVRSFGQLVAHVAGGQFLYCSQAAGRRLDSVLARRLNEVRPFSDVATAGTARTFVKQELVSLLAESTAYCRPIYAEFTDSDTSNGGEQPKVLRATVRALILNIAHDNEHYGNVVTYLRLNGLIPPSTERSSSRGRER